MYLQQTTNLLVSNSLKTLDFFRAGRIVRSTEQAAIFMGLSGSSRSIPSASYRWAAAAE
ncbi:hypothetical protein [Streptomyces flavidovirens]